MSLQALFPILLGAHIVLAVSLLLPSLLLPFALRVRGRRQPEPGPIFRRLLWLQSNGTLLIGLGLAVTGAGLLLALGTQLLAQPWLMLALASTRPTWRWPSSSSGLDSGGCSGCAPTRRTKNASGGARVLAGSATSAT
jgi:hypothetical protein